MRVVLTRPRREAARWAQWLGQAGISVIELPLIEIGPAPDPQALARVCADEAAWTDVMFVSAAAADGFFDFVESNRPVTLGKWTSDAIKTRAWATGPGTRAALVRHGVPPGRIDAPVAGAPAMDSEALWQVVGPGIHPDRCVLIVRGADEAGEIAGRDWLAQQLITRGATVEQVASYSRRVPAWAAATRAVALRALADGSLWLFSSSQAVKNLRGLLGPEVPMAAPALATHPRIADAARGAGFTPVKCCQPTPSDVIASIESFR